MGLLQTLFRLPKGPKLEVTKEGRVYPVIAENDIFTLTSLVPKKATRIRVNADGSGAIWFVDYVKHTARERRAQEREAKRGAQS